jgi:hypothetical protein
MASFELLERLRGNYRPSLELVEHRPAAELISSVDLVRTDALGRQVVVCPSGQVPPSWLELTTKERASLVDPPQPLPEGWLEPGHAGFTPHNVRLGFTVEHPDW